jgi:hypothetical protein
MLLSLLRLFAKQDGPQPLEAELGLLQGKQQPKMECDQLDQDTSIVCGQGIAFESLNQRLAVFSTECGLVWSLHRGLHPSDRQYLIRESGSSGGRCSG